MENPLSRRAAAKRQRIRAAGITDAPAAREAQFAGSAERANAVLADWRVSCRTPTDAPGSIPRDAACAFDYLLILSYVAGLLLLLFLTMSALQTAAMRVVGTALVVLLLVAGVFDVLENLALKGMLDGSTPVWLPGNLPPGSRYWPPRLATWLSGALPDVARISASVKFAILAGVILYLLTAWGRLLRDNPGARFRRVASRHVRSERRRCRLRGPS